MTAINTSCFRYFTYRAPFLFVSANSSNSLTRAISFFLDAYKQGDFDSEPCAVPRRRVRMLLMIWVALARVEHRFANPTRKTLCDRSSTELKMNLLVQPFLHTIHEHALQYRYFPRSPVRIDVDPTSSLKDSPGLVSQHGRSQVGSRICSLGGYLTARKASACWAVLSVSPRPSQHLAVHFCFLIQVIPPPAR
jgi:hypothetical protein